MADLAKPAGDAVRRGGKGSSRTVLDPAAGTGALLCAVGRPTALYAQEADPGLSALTALRLALYSPGSGADAPTLTARTGDTLRTDAFPGLTVDAVLCHPPFNERNWGHDDLAYDPRWEYGFPARTESELAWVQHALAHLREGGTAVVLMPPPRPHAARGAVSAPTCCGAVPCEPSSRSPPVPRPRTGSRSTSGSSASRAPAAPGTRTARRRRGGVRGGRRPGRP